MLIHSLLSTVTSMEPEFTQKQEVSKPQAQMFPLPKLPSFPEMDLVTSDLLKTSKIGSDQLMKPQFKLVNTTMSISHQEPTNLMSVVNTPKHTTQKNKIHSHKNMPFTVGYFPTKKKAVLMEDKKFSELSLTVKNLFLKMATVMNGVVMNSQLMTNKLDIMYWSDLLLMEPSSSTPIPSESKMPVKIT